VCHQCGKHYVGTAATGNAYRYRYYTCWSRNRYGTSTCDADRLPAEELDDAILASLLKTYERRATFVRACRDAAQQADGQRASWRDQLAAAEAEIAKAEKSIERYFLAFENGTMPEARCAERVNALGDRIVELRARCDELHALLDAPAPEAPSEETLRLLREQVQHVMKHGEEAQRKAVIRELVQEVRVVSRDEILPMFRVPDEHCATQVRIDDGIVGVTVRHKNLALRVDAAAVRLSRRHAKVRRGKLATPEAAGHPPGNDHPPASSVGWDATTLSAGGTPGSSRTASESGSSKRTPSGRRSSAHATPSLNRASTP
jgi:site-specific DNA recombinase